MSLRMDQVGVGGTSWLVRKCLRLTLSSGSGVGVSVIGEVNRRYTWIIGRVR